MSSTDWRERCKGKLTSLRRAISMIRRGEHIHISDGSATPIGILPGLVDDAAPLGDNEIIHMMTLGDAPYTRAEFADRFRHNAIFIGANVREAVGQGRADYTPVFLSEVPGLIRSRRIPVNVSIIAVSPPDEEGWCTFGTHVDISPAAVSVARLIIAEVNPRMPRTHGPARIHIDQIHAMVEIDHDIPELRPPPPKPETEAIAHNIADLVPDGATLQLGIGAIPNAVLRFLDRHKDLGVHTEMISDGVMDLVNRGVITGKLKTLHPDKIITSFVMGSKALYDFVDRNPMIEVHPIDYTNDPFIIAKHDDMIAINTALEIDLTGQVCSDSIGRSFYSGIGGQVDFIRGAARSKRGKPIIALPSTARSGTVSRIVPRLDDGAGVVTTRGDVHWVVTEYGAVNLHGRNVRERAMSLIAIAHPKFRPWLIAEAKQHRLIYTDQIELPVQTPVYPRDLEIEIVAKDGTTILIRPVKPTDESMMHDMFYRFSRETVYQRFFAIRNYLPHASLQKFCTIDYEKEMTLLAIVQDGENETIVGMSLYSIDDNSGYAEAAVVISDDYQGRGLGTMLMRALTDIAEKRRLKGFTADVLADNVRMLRVFERCGHAPETTLHGNVVSLRIPFKSGGPG